MEEALIKRILPHSVEAEQFGDRIYAFGQRRDPEGLRDAYQR